MGWNLQNQLIVDQMNHAAMRHARAALGQVENEPFSIVVLGDSIAGGYYVTNPLLSPFYRMLRLIQNEHGAGGSVGFVGVQDWQSGWSGNSINIIDLVGLGRNSWEMGTTTDWEQITCYCDRFWLIFTGSAVTGSVNITIDGAAAVGSPYNTASGALSLKVFDSGEIPLGTHVIRIAPTANTLTYLSGIYPFVGDFSKGPRLWDLGHAGFRADNFTPAAAADHWMGFAPEIMNPDLVFIEFGINEMVVAQSAATFKTHLSARVDDIYTYCGTKPSVALLAMWGIESRAESLWLPYREAMRDLARERTLGFVDVHKVSGWIGRTATVKIPDVLATSTSNGIITSNKALFRALDVGLSVQHPRFSGTPTIASRQSPTQVTLSANAATTGTGTLTILNRKDPDLYTGDGTHASDRGADIIGVEAMRVVSRPRQKGNRRRRENEGGAGAVGTIATATAFLPFSVTKLDTETLQLIGIRLKIESGTSATMKVQRQIGAGAWADVTGLTGLVANTTGINPMLLESARVNCNDGDRFRMVCTAVSGVPTTLDATLIFERTSA